jgi:hypothetical protein
MDNEPFSKVLWYDLTDCKEYAMLLSQKNMTDLLVFTCLFAKIWNSIESTSITFPFLINMGWNNSLDNEPFSKVLLYNVTDDDENAMLL